MTHTVCTLRKSLLITHTASLHLCCVSHGLLSCFLSVSAPYNQIKGMKEKAHCRLWCCWDEISQTTAKYCLLDCFGSTSNNLCSEACPERRLSHWEHNRINAFAKFFLPPHFALFSPLSSSDLGSFLSLDLRYKSSKLDTITVVTNPSLWNRKLFLRCLKLMKVCINIRRHGLFYFIQKSSLSVVKMAYKFSLKQPPQHIYLEIWNLVVMW